MWTRGSARRCSPSTTTSRRSGRTPHRRSGSPCWLWRRSRPPPSTPRRTTSATSCRPNPPCRWRCALLSRRRSWAATTTASTASSSPSSPTGCGASAWRRPRRRVGSASRSRHGVEAEDDELARATDVLAHEAPRLVRGPALDRPQDGGVLLDVLLEQVRAARQREPGQPPREAPVQVGERQPEALVARGLLDGDVEEVVGLLPVAQRLVGRVGRPTPRREQAGDRAAEQPLRLSQAIELRVLDARRRQLGREPFELGAHLVALADLARGRVTDERAAVRAELDQAGRLELPQRLADRRPADSELVGERLLPQARARRDLAAQDASLQRRGELVDQRAAVFLGLKSA